MTRSPQIGLSLPEIPFRRPSEVSESRTQTRRLPFPLNQPELARKLGQILKDCGFPTAGLRDVLARKEARSIKLNAQELPLYLRRLSGKSQLNSLFKLFFLGVALDREEAALAFSPLSLDEMVCLG